MMMTMINQDAVVLMGMQATGSQKQGSVAPKIVNRNTRQTRDPS